MRRLLQISFDLSLLSFIPIISWLALGMIVDSDLINVFTLIYPIQFIWYILKSIFSTGANIISRKELNKDATMSGIFIGSLVGMIVFGIIILNVDFYIKFMNMDPVLYKEYAIYALAQLYIQLVFNFYLEKLYFENKNKLANNYSLAFNAINFLVLITSAIVFKNNITVIILTIFAIAAYLIFVILKESDSFKISFNIFSSIKYDSVELVNNIAFFFIFLFGLSNAFEFGEVYATSLTFISLITDTQWDVYTSVVTVAKIDISSGVFNYKKHRNDAYRLCSLLFLSSSLMFLLLYRFYDLNIYITFIFILFDFIGFILFPIYKIKTCFLQLEYSALKMSANKVVSSIVRFFASILNTPYCIGIGHSVSTIYQFLTVNYIFKRNFEINKIGNVIKKYSN